jgi:hypothetical protein
MDRNLNIDVMCCFCGETISYEKAVHLTIQINYRIEEKQQLFSHTTCLMKRINKSVVLHPDFFDENEIVSE